MGFLNFEFSLTIESHSMFALLTKRRLRCTSRVWSLHALWHITSRNILNREMATGSRSAYVEAHLHILIIANQKKNCNGGIYYAFIYIYAGVIHKTEWTILDKTKPCSPAARKCDLRLEEKYHTLLEKSRLLNKRSETFGTCPHRRKHLLQNSDRSNEENSA